MNAVLMPKSEEDVQGHIEFKENVDLGKIKELLANAGIDGHIVLFSLWIKPEENTIVFLRWAHFTWAQVKDAFENTLRTEFPKIVLE